MSDDPAPDIALRLRLPRDGFTLDVDLRLPGRGITVLFGASGSGKTTLLRAVAGLERGAAGHVRVGADAWQDDARGVFVPTWRRALGYVFQEASLFDHLDVAGNLRYGLQRAPAAGGEQALQAAIALLGIGGLLRRRPAQLSGGERQRVAIARALATQPRLLLLDEPMAALDLARRQEVLPWLEGLRDGLQDGLGLPMLYVTHSADEMARLADHLVVLRDGRVQAEGPAAEVLAGIDAPVLPGEDIGALLSGQVVERDEAWQLCRVAFDGGSLWLRDAGLAPGLPAGHAVRLRVLARDVSLATALPLHTSIQNLLPGVVDSTAPDPGHGSQCLVRLRCGSSLLLARVTRRAYSALALAPGAPVWLQVKAVALVR